MLPQDTIQRLKTGVRENLEDSLALYRHFHANAELSEQEEQTAARVARELEALAVPVTAGIGGHGVVGLLENGPGPVIMLRADMDALPIKEETGLEYACTATAKGYNGEETPVMHACGHDVHTTVLMGVARTMSGLKDLWQGTLIILAQPAEEGLGGARAMIEDGLWKRFPRPDAGLGLHVNPELAAGTVGLAEDYVCAGATSLDLIVRGMGGHGAYPHKTKDPVVLSAQIIMALQTIVSRGVNPLKPLVITAGSIHGGTKRNIIGEKVVLNLTVRSFNPEVMDQAVSDIRRAAEGTARAMGLPEDRLPQLVEAETPLPPVRNDRELVPKIRSLLRGVLGQDKVSVSELMTGSEDFGILGWADPPFPMVFYHLGSTSRARLDAAKEKGEEVPLLHTSRFYPDPEETLETGITTLSAAALELFRQG